jgi:hypothetical protein
MKNDPVELLENKELIDKLRSNGYGEIIDTFFNNDDEIYTKRGRVNKSGMCRTLQCKPKELDDIFTKWRQILANELD